MQDDCIQERIIENKKILHVLNMILTVPLTELTPEKIFKNECLYKELKDSDIDYELLSKYGCPYEWFDNIKQKCLVPGGGTCAECWKDALDDSDIIDDARAIFDIPNLHNISADDNFFDRGENLQLYEEEARKQEELQRYKNTGLTADQIDELLDIYRWKEFEDFDILTVMSRQMMGEKIEINELLITIAGKKKS